MIAWCQSLKDAITNDSHWKATVPFPSTFAPQINSIVFKQNESNQSCIENEPSNLSYSHACNSSTNISSTISMETNDYDESHYNHDKDVDIVGLLGDISPQLSIYLKDISTYNKYPTNAIFKFEDYSNKSDQTKLIQHISSSAINYGTVLSIQKANPVSDRNPFYSVVLACVHFGNPRSTKYSSKKTFVTNKAQANNTIKQMAHAPTSIKNKSRNSHYERVKFESSHDELDLNNQISIDGKINRSSSKKCNCTFSFTIFYDPHTLSWYLKNKKSLKDSNMYHNNHIWINPIHLTMPKNTVSPSVMHSIECLISSGHDIPSIQLFVKDRYKENIDYQTIYNLRMNSISSLLKACNEKPYGTSVDKLIAIFKNTKSVSFVYILHRANSGFVTFRKSRNQSLSEYVSDFNSDINNQLSTKSISNWRGALSLSDSNNVLVAFAWAHDEELKAAQKHPQFLACDVTFGVNRERRELFLVAGSDGRNRTFTAFRCFIPSKQEQAYSWILNEGLTHILSSDTLKFNQCISCDQEIALISGINNAINSNKVAFSNSKMRLDCFHFFNKVWMEKVVLKSRDSNESKSCLKVLKDWIRSWFNYIESEEEFCISLKRFMSYFESKQSIIGDVASDECVKLISNIKSKKHHLLHYFFLDVATFDFVGDSIVEGANYPIKYGTLKVSSKMDISNSGYTQLKSTEAKYIAEYVSSAKTINSKKTWSQSLTSEYLTNYAEGIACSNFDRISEYIKKRIETRKWFVVHKNFVSTSNDIDINNVMKQTRFIRVRVVTLTHSNHLTCDCGYPKRMLMPCVHICCIVEDILYYTIELFNLKWWKHFNYYYKLGSSKYDEQTRKSLDEALQKSRIDDFDSNNGKYLGVPLNGTPLLEKLMNHIHIDTNSNDNDLNMMITIHNMRLNNKPIEKGSHTHHHLIKSKNDNIISNINLSIDVPIINTNVNNDNIIESFINDNNYNQFDIDHPASMGAGSQVESQLSQFREDSSSKQMKRKDIINDNYYNEIEPYFKELVKTIKNKEQLLESIDVIEKQTFKNIANDDNRTQVDNLGTTFLGEHNGPKRKETRHKFLYERFNK